MVRAKHRTRSDRGFTLIELMVVVLVLGILMAIAVPTYLGARERAQDRKTQATLMLVDKAALIYWFGNGGKFDGLPTTDMSANVPGPTYLRGQTDSKPYTAIATGNTIAYSEYSNRVYIFARSDSGRCWSVIVIRGWYQADGVTPQVPDGDYKGMGDKRATCTLVDADAFWNWSTGAFPAGS